jgi:hypothetical protein
MPKTIGVSGLKPARGAVHKVRTPCDSNSSFELMTIYTHVTILKLWYDIYIHRRSDMDAAVRAEGHLVEVTKARRLVQEMASRRLDSKVDRRPSRFGFLSAASKTREYDG